MQHNQYFTIAATFDQLLRRLEEYAAARPPLSCKGIRFVVEDPIDLFDPEWLRGRSATAHCYSRWETNEPLFLVAGPEGKASCRVRMRELDPRIHDWLDALLDWLAPDWTTDDAQPLPEVPRHPRIIPAAPDCNPPTPIPKSRRGPKPGRTPEEMEAFAIQWRKEEQYHNDKEEFCRNNKISPYLLDKACRELDGREKDESST